MKKYDVLLKRYDDLVQYSIYVPGDYAQEIALEVGEVMQIPVDIELIKRTIYNRARKRGEESICLFSHPDDQRCFILIDCNPGDWIYSIIVRCPLICHKVVNEVMLRWYNFCLKEEKQTKQYDKLENDMFYETNPLQETIIRHRLDII